MKLIRWKRAALRLRTSDVIVRMSKRERGKYRGLLSGPPGEPEPEKPKQDQKHEKRTGRANSPLGDVRVTVAPVAGAAVEIPVKSWQAVGYFALSPCGRG